MFKPNPVTMILAVGAVVPILLTVNWVSSGGPTDFAYFWNAGRAVLQGRSWHSSLFPYPPQALFLFVPFALLPLWMANFLFDALGVFVFLWAAKPYCADLPTGSPVLTPAALFCLLYGQTGLIVGALWLFAFQGKWPAVALLTIKPHIGVLSALSLRRKTILPAIALSFGLFAIAALTFGEVRAFFETASGQLGAIGTNTKWPYVGVGPAIGYGFLGWIAFAAAAILLLSFNVNAFTAATAALLVTPYAFHYDMTAASLGFLLQLQSEKSGIRSVAFTSALMVPVLVRLGAWIAPPLLLCALWAYNGEFCLKAVARSKRRWLAARS